MTTLQTILDALATIPEAKYIGYHYDQCVASWSSWVTTNDQNKLGMMLNSERELSGSVEFYLKASLGLEAGVYPENPALAKAAQLWALAKLHAVRDYINQFKFYAALVSPEFGYVTNGHRVSPDAYHVYRSDPASPTGVCLEIRGPKNKAYADLIAAAKRHTSTSRSPS